MPTKPEHQPGPGADREVGGPASTAGVATDEAAPLIEVSDLYVHYSMRRGPLARLSRSRKGGDGAVRAVDGVSFSLRRGEVLGLVGESGSGKSTLGRALLGLVPASSGSIRFDGTELVGLPERRLRPLRRRLQMVFQDPHASLNPAMDVGTAVGHPLKIHGLGGADLQKQVERALEMVGLAPARRYLNMRPADLSGGQKQRVVIARAAILDPELMVADEPVSMLDMSVRAKILQLLLDLRRQLNLTYLYITHDLATAKLFCDRIAIMYLGRIVEIGRTEEVFANPRHPYTQALLRAVPDLGSRREDESEVVAGEIPDAARPPAGCSYHPRCPHAFAPCGSEGRDLRALLEARWAGPGEVTERGAGDPAGPGVGLEREDPARVVRLGDLDAAGEHLPIRPAHGHHAADVLRVLTRARDDGPDEPLWRGVRAMREEGGQAVVDFEPAIDPGLLDTGGARVACHLFDPRFDRSAVQQVS
ncbi:hypothetical protein GCM10023322_72890 [Rugosimonospora acidiphila]|uniref:ABC transporter domain-containing protein n=1 Tax=Rugosimonospora acidiphila TaxID=556531 RepID=A0ABP9SLS8_9ACTN